MRATFFLSLILVFSIHTGYSQNDTIYQIDPAEVTGNGYTEFEAEPGQWYKLNPYRGIIAPIALAGLGVAAINNPIYDRHDFKDDVFDPEFGGSRIDDYLIFAPYVTLVGLNLAKIPCENDFINTSLIILKAEIINTALTYAIKFSTRMERPNGENLRAFPSGHTSQAFLAATIVNREFRYKSPWIGAAAYGMAGTVGLFRILNNKHWLSDVLTGAGIGILSANITYMTHQWRWGRPGTCLAPTMIDGKPGVYFSYKF